MAVSVLVYAAAAVHAAEAGAPLLPTEPGYRTCMRWAASMACRRQKAVGPVGWLRRGGRRSRKRKGGGWHCRGHWDRLVRQGRSSLSVGSHSPYCRWDRWPAAKCRSNAASQAPCAVTKTSGTALELDSKAQYLTTRWSGEGSLAYGAGRASQNATAVEPGALQGRRLKWDRHLLFHGLNGKGSRTVAGGLHSVPYVRLVA